MMIRKLFKITLALILFFLPILSVQGAPSNGKAEKTIQTIEYLIKEIATSRLTFIRNDDKHSGEEAAKHIRKKYEHYKSQIESPEDFIRLSASKSLISGRPYLVVTPQGEIELEKWLMMILGKYRKD